MEAAGMYTGAKCSKETLVIVPNGLTWHRISSKDGHVKMLINCQQCCHCNEMTLYMENMRWRGETGPKWTHRIGERQRAGVASDKGGTKRLAKCQRDHLRGNCTRSKY